MPEDPVLDDGDEIPMGAACVLLNDAGESGRDSVSVRSMLLHPVDDPKNKSLAVGLAFGAVFDGVEAPKS